MSTECLQVQRALVKADVSRGKAARTPATFRMVYIHRKSRLSLMKEITFTVYKVVQKND